ncbi:MAG: hypothetical protein IB616_05010 [Methanosarcinales archaeon]|nr:MAG: hypothetical protein IB616_05010 [Methanosarcinales archaeon]
MPTCLGRINGAWIGGAPGAKRRAEERGDEAGVKRNNERKKERRRRPFYTTMASISLRTGLLLIKNAH